MSLEEIAGINDPNALTANSFVSNIGYYQLKADSLKEEVTQMLFLCHGWQSQAHSTEERSQLLATASPGVKVNKQ